MRNVKYFWKKRLNILLGLLAVAPLPFFTYMWLRGGLAHENEILGSWTNPGFLSFPVSLSIIFFVGGLIALLYVFFRCDIDEVLPLKQPLPPLQFPYYHYQLTDGPYAGAYFCPPVTQMSDSMLNRILEEQDALIKAGHKVLNISFR